MKSLLDKAAEYAFSELKKVGDDPTGLPIPLQTLVIIYSAQGIIDNGGFRYFFESDFPKNPPYSLFSDAYQRIGAEEAAANITKAVSMFPFPEPHRSEEKRQDFLSTHESLNDYGEFFALGDKVCGDESIWKKLERYVEENRQIFKIA